MDPVVWAVGGRAAAPVVGQEVVWDGAPQVHPTTRRVRAGSLSVVVSRRVLVARLGADSCISVLEVGGGLGILVHVYVVTVRSVYRLTVGFLRSLPIGLHRSLAVGLPRSRSVAVVFVALRGR